MRSPRSAPSCPRLSPSKRAAEAPETQASPRDHRAEPASPPDVKELPRRQIGERRLPRGEQSLPCAARNQPGREYFLPSLVSPFVSARRNRSPIRDDAIGSNRAG